MSQERSYQAMQDSILELLKTSPEAPLPTKVIGSFNDQVVARRAIQDLIDANRICVNVDLTLRINQ